MLRPTSVTVFGVLNLIFGFFGILSTGFLAAVLISGSPVINANTGGALVDWWMRINTGLAIVFSLVLFVSGIGLLRMRPWGRKFSIGYSVYAIVSTVVGVIVQFSLMIVPIMDAQRGGNLTAFAMLVPSVVGSCIGLIYPILLWFFMTRPHVIAAFQGNWMGWGLAPDGGGSSPFAESLVTIPTSSNPYVAPPPGTGANFPHGSRAESLVESLVPSKNGDALAAYYLGLFSLFPGLGALMGLAAVYFGVKGVRRERMNPAVRGGIHAWVGIVCGVLFGLLNWGLIAVAVSAVFLSR